MISLLLYQFFQTHLTSAYVLEVLNGFKSASLGLISSVALTIIGFVLYGSNQPEWDFFSLHWIAIGSLFYYDRFFVKMEAPSVCNYFYQRSCRICIWSVTAVRMINVPNAITHIRLFPFHLYLLYLMLSNSSFFISILPLFGSIIKRWFCVFKKSDRRFAYWCWQNIIRNCKHSPLSKRSLPEIWKRRTRNPGLGSSQTDNVSVDDLLGVSKQKRHFGQ